MGEKEIIIVLLIFTAHNEALCLACAQSNETRITISHFFDSFGLSLAGAT